MDYKVLYTNSARRDLSELPKQLAGRIIKKIDYFRQQKNPILFAKRLTNFAYGMYRFRVGDYRIIFDLAKKGQITILLILNVKHRKEVYRL